MDFKDLEEEGVVLERTLRGEDGEKIAVFKCTSDCTKYI